MIEIPTLVDIETRREFLEYTVRQMKDGMIYVELGCWVGGTISFVGQIIKFLKKDIKIFAIDNWICRDLSFESKNQANCHKDYYERFLHNIASVGISDIVIPLKGDSLDCAKNFQDKSIDVLFDDCDHNYPATLHDIQAYTPKMKPDSIWIGHDYSGTESVRRAVRECFGSNFTLSSNSASYMVKNGKGIE
jgi:hypothetical protein